MKWLKYFQNLQKQHALSCKSEVISIEYGDVIYQSGYYLGRRWLVTNFQGEFDVFVELEKMTHEIDRHFAAAFPSKDRAIAFATEMFLVCCGKLHRGYKLSHTGLI